MEDSRARDGAWSLAHTSQWDFRFCFYPNVLFPPGVYNKDKDGENGMEKERFKALCSFSRAAVTKHQNHPAVLEAASAKATCWPASSC